MEHILLFDTSIGTDNVGDEIIVNYCWKQLSVLFNSETYYLDRIPTHLEIRKSAYKLCNNAKYSLVCGTNILKTSILWKKGWKIGLREALNIKNICLMGAGWGNYNKFRTDPYTKFVYKSILSKKLLHSVRDGYTELKLKGIGINNVINTACPTMWSLTEKHCSSIPKIKSSKVVTALTYYKPDIEKDRLMFDILHDNYKTIYLWIQQAQDYDYFKQLQVPYKVNIIRPILSEYDALLSQKDIDFIGSRLHGGIRALNYGCRSLIIGIDNRAKEINRDTNLPYIERINIKSLDKWINESIETNIFLPKREIEEWKMQFVL